MCPPPPWIAAKHHCPLCDQGSALTVPLRLPIPQNAWPAEEHEGWIPTQSPADSAQVPNWRQRGLSWLFLGGFSRASSILADFWEELERRNETPGIVIFWKQNICIAVALKLRLCSQQFCWAFQVRIRPLTILVDFFFLTWLLFSVLPEYGRLRFWSLSDEILFPTGFVQADFCLFRLTLTSNTMNHESATATKQI